MTRTGEREIGAVSGRLPDNPGELACMSYGRTSSPERRLSDQALIKT